MSEMAAQLMPTLLALPAEDRELLAQALYESLHADDTAEDDPAFTAELDRRVEQMQTGKIPPMPYAELLQRMREKYP